MRLTLAISLLLARCAIGQPFSLNDAAFLSQQASGSAFAPSQIPGMALWVHLKDGGTDTNAIASVTDRIQGMVFSQDAAILRPTGTVYGAYWNNRTAGALSNSPGISVATNFSVWIVYRPDSSWNTGSYMPLFNRFSPLTGFYARQTTRTIDFYFSTDHNCSDANYYTSPNLTSFVWANGTCYTNGVLWGTSAIPTSYPIAFGNIGSEGPGQGAAAGYYVEIGVWTNTTLTAAQALSLQNYSLAN